jgi:hypothetical protein
VPQLAIWHIASARFPPIHDGNVNALSTLLITVFLTVCLSHNCAAVQDMMQSIAACMPAGQPLQLVQMPASNGAPQFGVVVPMTAAAAPAYPPLQQQAYQQQSAGYPAPRPAYQQQVQQSGYQQPNGLMQQQQPQERFQPQLRQQYRPPAQRPMQQWQQQRPPPQSAPQPLHRPPAQPPAFSPHM